MLDQLPQYQLGHQLETSMGLAEQAVIVIRLPLTRPPHPLQLSLDLVGNAAWEEL